MADSISPPAPDTAPPAPSNPVQDKVAQARAAGVSWDDIGSYLAPKYEEARQAGVSIQQINDYLGVKDPAPVLANVQKHLEDVYRNGDGQVDVAKVRQIYADAMKGGHDAGWFGNAVATIANGVVQGAKQGWGTGPLEIPKEENESRLQTLGRILQIDVGAASRTLSAGFGAVQGGVEATGAALGAPILGRDLAAAPEAFMGSPGALGRPHPAATAAGDALARKLPTQADTLDNAVALQQSVKPEIAPGQTSIVKDNLATQWARTGELPTDTVQRSMSDPHLRDQLLVPQPPEPPAGSSTTPTPAGDFIIPKMQPGAIRETGVGADNNPGNIRAPGSTGAANEAFRSYATLEDGVAAIKQNLLAYQDQHGLNTVRGIINRWAPPSENPTGRLVDQAAKRMGVEPDQVIDLHDPATMEKAITAIVQQEGRMKVPQETIAQVARTEYKGSTLEQAMKTRPGEVGAVGNLPQPKLDPDMELMLGRVGEERTSWLDTIRDTADKVYRELFRPDHPLNKLQEAAENGTPLEDANNPRFLRRLAENADSTAQYVVERRMVDLDGNEVGPGLKQILSQAGADRFSQQQFQAFAIAKWAVEKAEQAKETGVNVDAAKRIVAAYPQFEQPFNQLVQFQNQSLSWLRDAGVISDDRYQAMVDENKARIPGYRVDEQGQRIGQTGGKVGTGIKEFFGSTSKIQDPIKSILGDNFVRIKIARRNVANRSLVDILEGLQLAEKTRSVQHKFELSPEEIKAFGVGDSDAAIWRALGHELRDDEIPVFRDGKLEAWKVFKDPATGEVDRTIVDYVRGFTGPQMATWQRLLRAPAVFQRAMVVMNPLFPVRLMLYDVPWQFVVKPGLRNTLADYIVGLRSIIGNSAEYDAYLKSGAAERIFKGLSADGFIRDIMRGREDPSIARAAWNVVETPMEKLRAWNQLLTQPVKVGRYIRGVAGGESPMTAAAAASEAAFHRASFGGAASKALNSVHPFSAAYLNSLEQTFRSLIIGDKTITGQEIKVWQTWAKAAAIITVPALGNWAMNRDEEWYKAVPEWQKNSGMNWNVGGHVIYVPFPPVMGFLFGGLPKMLLEGYVSGNTKGLAGSVLQQLALSFAPSAGLFLAGNVFQPMIEHIANHSFFRDAPLVSQDTMNRVLPPEQSSPWSSGAARWLSRNLSWAGANISPNVIDNYIQGWGGTMGVAAVRGADLLFHTGPRAGNPPPISLEDLPLLGSWTARYPSASAQPIKDFDAKWTQFQQTHGSLVAAAAAGDMGRVQEILREAGPTAVAAHSWNLSKESKAKIGEQPDAQQFATAVQGTAAKADLQAAQTIVMAGKALENLRKYASVVNNAPLGSQVSVPEASGEFAGRTQTLSPTDKRQLLDRIYMGLQATAEHGLQAMAKAGM